MTSFIAFPTATTQWCLCKVVNLTCVAKHLKDIGRNCLPIGECPGGRQAFAMVYDSKRKRTILFGGMDGKEWKEIK